ncbi:MAG: 50S ribosomal protein L29 [Thermodesulfobacteriota bacterium]
MKTKDLRALSPDELRTKVKDHREELFRLRFQHSIQQLGNTARLRLIRRDIARIETVLREK